MPFNAHYLHYLTALTQHGLHYVRRYERHVAYSKILRPPRGGAGGGGTLQKRYFGRDVSLGLQYP